MNTTQSLFEDVKSSTNDLALNWFKSNLRAEYGKLDIKRVNNKIIIYGNVLIPNNCKELPYKIDEVYGNVKVDNIIHEPVYGKLKSLKNFPTIIHGDFICKMNKELTSLEGGPESVDGCFICAGCGLKDLNHMPKYIGGSMDIYCNNIKNLSPVMENKVGGLICAQFNLCETTELYSTLKKSYKISEI